MTKITSNPVRFVVLTQMVGGKWKNIMVMITASMLVKQDAEQ